jgi:hypothetical protein
MENKFGGRDEFGERFSVFWIFYSYKWGQQVRILPDFGHIFVEIPHLEFYIDHV